jgi:hypothetical protein
MIHAHILTTWTLEHLYDLERLRVAGDSIVDACGTLVENIIPDPNTIVVECWLSVESYNAILDDPNYGEASILWSEEVENDV